MALPTGRWAAAVALGVSVACGAGEEKPAPVRAEAVRRAPIRREAEVRAVPVERADPGIARRQAAPLDTRMLGRARARVGTPDPLERHARVRTPVPLDLRDLEPAAFVAAVERVVGPLEGAHYVVDRGSEAWSDGRVARVDGGLSLLDCRPRDPDRPERGARLWVGGLRLEGAPEVFAAEIEERLPLSLFGDETVSHSARWNDMVLIRGQLSGLSRLLAGGVDEQTRDGVTVWRRDLTLDPSQPSTAEPASLAEGDGCPDQLSLHLRVTESLEHWIPRESEEGVRPYRERLEEVGELAGATLYLRRVSFVPEIVDRSQRALPTRVMVPSVTAVRSSLAPAGTTSGVGSLGPASPLPSAPAR